MRHRTARQAHRRSVTPPPGWVSVNPGIDPPALWAISATLPALVPAAASPTAPRLESNDTILKREAPLTQYRALRRMHARSERFDQEGWLDAWTEYDGRG